MKKMFGKNVSAQMTRQSDYTPIGAENLLYKSLYPMAYDAWHRVYYAK